MRIPSDSALARDTLFIRIIAAALLLVCVLLLLSQTAFAQNTYVITDGDRVVVHTTSVTDPAAVLDEAGLILDQDDTYTTAVTGDGVSEITVQRNQMVTIHYNGKQMQVAAYGETVEALLNRLNISTSGNTTVSASLDAVTYNVMELSVSRTVREVETYSVPVPHKTVYQEDPTLPAGTETVLSQGMDGQKQCTASVLYVGGEEASRIILSETVTAEPTDEIVVVGTAQTESDVPKDKSDDFTPIGGPAAEIGDGIITLPSGEVLTYTDVVHVLATAYTKTDEGCNDITATGTYARVGAIAVDPRLIPYGTRMYILSDDGAYVYGIATAEDCGGSIKGNRVDLYYDTTAECFQFGRRNCTIYILG